MWLLLKGERGKDGVFGLGIEAGAVFLHLGEVAVDEDLRAGVIVLQGKSRKTHVTLKLLWEEYRKYCQDEGIDHKWLQEYKRTYPNESKPVQQSEPEPQSFIPLVIEEENTQPKSVWQVSHLRLESPDGGFIDINSNNLAAVTSLLQSLSSPC